MDFIMKVMNFIARTLGFIFCVVYNYPKLWICTYIIRRRVKKMTLATITSTDVLTIVTAVVAVPANLRLELADISYVLPTNEIIEYITNNIWQPYKKVRQFVYGENYDCDNFANSFFNLVQELQLGLCIGIEHLMVDAIHGHAINCFILDDRKFYNLEPQADICSSWKVLEGTNIWFVYMEGREKL